MLTSVIWSFWKPQTQRWGSGNQRKKRPRIPSREDASVEGAADEERGENQGDMDGEVRVLSMKCLMNDALEGLHR